MSVAYLIQTAASGVAILILAALAWKFGVARHPGPLTKERALSLMALDRPADALGPVWLAADGRSALARAGSEAVILYAVGDGHVVRTLPWDSLARGEVRNGRVRLLLADRSAPFAWLTIGEGAAWPPALDA